MNLVVLISGKGTNCEEILKHQELFNYNVSLIVTNRVDYPRFGNRSAAEEYCAKRNNNCKFVVENRYDNENRIDYDMRLAKSIKNKAKPDLIVLAGWMHILSKEFLEQFTCDIINLHPALPGCFPGAHAIEDAYKAFRKGEIKHTGVMCHKVTPIVDEGEVLSKINIECREDDTLEELTSRVKKLEKGVLLQGVLICLTRFREKQEKVKDIICYNGKVRQVLDIGYNLLLLEASDRLSAFDKHRCIIKNKGKSLNKMSAWWLNHTKHIIPNHYLWHNDGKYMIVKKTKPIKLEIVVRGYLTGSTSTSIWPMYERGERKMYGIQFPDGLRKNEKLKEPIITPTTKGVNDHPITREQIIKEQYLTEEECDFIYDRALKLFKFGQEEVSKKGLILVDTKYEFGRTENGEIILIDEIHTCDSSRYWKICGYEHAFHTGNNPSKLDKDIVRDWIKNNTKDPYVEYPEVPEDVKEKVSTVYKEYYDLISGDNIDLDKISSVWSAETDTYSLSTKEVIENYLSFHHEPRVEIIAGSVSDMKHVEKIKAELEKNNIYSNITYSSAHKETQNVVNLINNTNKNFKRVVWVTVAGRSNALSGVLAANSKHPVIGCPPFADKMDMMVNINSTIQCPSKVPVMAILDPGNVALAIKKIFNLV